MPAQSSSSSLLNSRRTGRFALALCRSLPPGPGERLARWVGRRIAARRQTALVQAFRANQWVLGGKVLTGARLDTRVESCFEHVALGFYQLFHYSNSPTGLQSLVEFSPVVEALIARSLERRSGLLVAGVHMSGFDLVAQAIFQRGLRGVSLTLPEAESNDMVEWQHTLRRRSGMELLPGSIGNLRRVVERLEQGEMALTGIDRPMHGLKYRPKFFGLPAELPTHHVYLALKARVPVIVIGAARREDGRYHVLVSPEIVMRPDADRQREILLNAESILEAAQAIICQAPEQWCVPYPLWPEAGAP